MAAYEQVRRPRRLANRGGQAHQAGGLLAERQNDEGGMNAVGAAADIVLGFAASGARPTSGAALTAACAAGAATALMVCLGHAYSHAYSQFMVDIRASNAKLQGRFVGMVVQATGKTERRCTRSLDLCDHRKATLV